MVLTLDLPTVVWSMVAGSALMLAAVHGLMWWQSRQSTAYVVFSVMATGVAGVAAVELLMMRQPDPLAFGRLVRNAHFPATLVAITLPIYLRLRLGKSHTGWFVAAILTRMIASTLNFTSPQSLAWHEVRTLHSIPLLGSNVWVVGDAVPNPLRGQGSLSLVLLGIYVLLMWTSHLRGNRRKESLALGAGYALWVLTAIVSTVLIQHEVIRFPYLISLPMLPLMGCIAWELSRETLQVAAFARRLEEQTADMELTSRVARIAHWKWDMPGNRIWASDGGRELYGLAGTGPASFDEFLAIVHEDDVPLVHDAIASARDTGWFHAEYRLRETGRPGQAAWVLACGQIEFDADRQPLRMRGLSMDIGERKAAEADARERREEVARLSRVGALGEISGSLAHELNQPLSAILHNAETAHRLLVRQPPATTEAAEACADAVAATLRARQVVQRLRALLEKGETRHESLNPDALIADVLDMMRTELEERAVTVDFQPGGVPPISGDRVQLQQVFLNIFLNGAEAMQEVPPPARLLRVSTKQDDGHVLVKVEDHGCGLPARATDLFEPFFTTKPHGLGMGLAVCRTIVRAHGGSISANSRTEGGSDFLISLPLPTFPPIRA